MVQNSMLCSRMLLAAAVVAVSAAAPSVASKGLLAKSKTCQRLCQDGLGGLPCGCDPDTVAKNLTKTMVYWRKKHPSDHVIMGPRRNVCSILCKLDLGEPLCGCSKEDGLSLGEVEICPLCEILKDDEKLWTDFKCSQEEVKNKCHLESAAKGKGAEKILDDDVGLNLSPSVGNRVDWNLWCHIQCDQGNGGIACNCDMLPLVH